MERFLEYAAQILRLRLRMTNPSRAAFASYGYSLQLSIACFSAQSMNMA